MFVMSAQLDVRRASYSTPEDLGTSCPATLGGDPHGETYREIKRRADLSLLCAIRGILYDGDGEI